MIYRKAGCISAGSISVLACMLVCCDVCKEMAHVLIVSISPMMHFVQFTEVGFKPSSFLVVMTQQNTDFLFTICASYGNVNVNSAALIMNSESQVVSILVAT